MHRLKWIFIFLFSLLISSHSYALREDTKDKIFIVADSSVYNYKTGIKVFTGHVKAIQGSTHLTADKVTTKDNDKHQIQEIVAYGENESAHYWTLPKVGDQQMHAYASIIKFFPLDSNVILEKNVLVKQGDNHFKGQLILYNMNDETITVPPSANGRAVLIYNPDK